MISITVEKNGARMAIAVISTVLGWVLITVIGIGTINWFVLSVHNLYNRILISIIDSGISGLIIELSQSCLAISPKMSVGICECY
jgi:hypothetical protein